MRTVKRTRVSNLSQVKYTAEDSQTSDLRFRRSKVKAPHQRKVLDINKELTSFYASKTRYLFASSFSRFYRDRRRAVCVTLSQQSLRRLAAASCFPQITYRPMPRLEFVASQPKALPHALLPHVAPERRMSLLRKGTTESNYILWRSGTRR